MNPAVKRVAKKIVHPALEWLDTVFPPFTTILIRYAKRYKAINDLHITNLPPYKPLGPYVTLYQKEPPHYKRFVKQYHFDAHGVPWISTDGVLCYNAVDIAQYGLAEYGYYLAGNNASHREQCLACAKGLLELQDERGGWLYSFNPSHPQTKYSLENGWYSAMAQGQAISLFARANALESNPAYADAAHRALALLETPLEQGGVLTKIAGREDLIFYEEWPSFPPAHILNGFIFCLTGLYDGAQIFQDSEASRLFKQGMRTLKTILPLYDGDKLSSYDLAHAANPPQDRSIDRKYHILHVKLLQALDSIQHEDIFTFYINKWGKHWR